MRTAREEDLPVPGVPKVEWLNQAKTVARWTFASNLRAVQWYQFNHWLGWYGFEEWDRPAMIRHNIWTVHRRGKASTELRDRDFAEAITELEEQSHHPDVQAMFDYFRDQQ